MQRFFSAKKATATNGGGGEEDCLARINTDIAIQSYGRVLAGVLITGALMGGEKQVAA